MTVRQLLASLDSRELSEWQQFLLMEHERSARETEAPVEQKLKAIFRSSNE